MTKDDIKHSGQNKTAVIGKNHEESSSGSDDESRASDSY
jgi:hypothetical protein